MTKPTQAQIEAAVTAYYRRQGDTIESRIAAALTAAAEAKPKPAQSQIEVVKDTLRRLVILTGDSPWDWDYVARKVLAAAHEARLFQ